jgi:hypothetical protein
MFVKQGLGCFLGKRAHPQFWKTRDVEGIPTSLYRAKTRYIAVKQVFLRPG